MAEGLYVWGPNGETIVAPNTGIAKIYGALEIGDGTIYNQKENFFEDNRLYNGTPFVHATTYSFDTGEYIPYVRLVSAIRIMFTFPSDRYDGPWQRPRTFVMWGTY